MKDMGAPNQPVQSDVGRLRIVATQPSQDLGSGIVQPRDQVARSTMAQGSLGKDANVADLGTLIEERGATEPEGLELPTPLDDAPVNAASVRPEQTAAPSSEEQRVAVAESVRQQPGMPLPSSPARIDDTQQVQTAQAGSSRGDAAPAGVGSKSQRTNAFSRVGEHCRNTCFNAYCIADGVAQTTQCCGY